MDVKYSLATLMAMVMGVNKEDGEFTDGDVYEMGFGTHTCLEDFVAIITRGEDGKRKTK